MGEVGDGQNVAKRPSPSFSVFGTAGVEIYLEPGNQGQEGPGVSGWAGGWDHQAEQEEGSRESQKCGVWRGSMPAAGGDVEARGLASFSELALCSVPWEAGT